MSVTKGSPSSERLFVFVVFTGAVGEQGGAKDPDVVDIALLQHMEMGA